MEVEKEKELSEKIKQILTSNGITDTVAEICINDSGSKGEGFASEAQYVTVKFQDDLNKVPLHLFIKGKTDNPSHTKLLTLLKAFEKESTFLFSYVRAAQELCKLKGQPDFIDFYPKCYYADENMILLENLVVGKGYSIKDPEQRQNLEDAKIAVKTLAKHHALGHVMIAENGGPLKFFERFPHLDFEAYSESFVRNMQSGLFDNSVGTIVKILENNDVPGAKETVEKLGELSKKGNPMQLVLEYLKIENESDFLVLGHGDYWNNNMMFLVDSPTQKPIHHVAIDFQVTRYNTPAVDLTFYFFTSIQHNVRRAHLKELLTLYKDTLNNVTELFGHPTNITLDQVLTDFRKKVGYGLILGFLMSIGPGAKLYKDMDISKVDVKDWPVIMDGLVNKWINDNPEKGKETAEELVKFIQEYEELKI